MLSETISLIREFAAFMHKARIGYGIESAPLETLFRQMAHGENGISAQDFIDFNLEDTALVFFDRKCILTDGQRNALALVELYNQMSLYVGEELTQSNETRRADEKNLYAKINSHLRRRNEGVTDVVAYSIEINRIRHRLDDLNKFAMALKSVPAPI